MCAEALRGPLCPDDFCPAELPASLALDALRKPGTELWLIRTPSDFSPASLNGCKVPLVGFQTLKSHRNEAGVRHRYQVLSNTVTGPETLLAPSSTAEGHLVPAPALQGTLSILEVPRTKSSGQSLHAIPTSPPPQIPPGLRPRFQAFGGGQPVVGPPPQSGAGERKASRKRKKLSESVSLSLSPGEVLNGVGEGQSLGQETLEPSGQMPVKVEEVAAPLTVKKKKKKKKKELEGEVMMEPAAEGMELAAEGMEPAAEMPGPENRGPELQQEAVLSLPKRKKSKKKRELEGEMIEAEVKQPEPEAQIDLQIGEAPSSGKKKSRKKQEAGREVLEPVGMEEEMPVLPPTHTEKEAGREMLEGTGMAENLGEAEPSPLNIKRKKKKRRRNPEQGEEMESMVGVSESVTPSPSQGVEEKKKKKRLSQGEIGTVEA